MWVIRCEIVEQAGSGVDKSDALLMSILVVVNTVKFVVHNSNEAANDEPVFGEGFSAVGSFTHCFYQRKNFEAEFADFSPIRGIFAC